MRRADLAKLLISAADARERRLLLHENSHVADVKLANEIRKKCYASWTVEPVLAQKAALAMRALVSVNKDLSIRSIAVWVQGISSITKGRFQIAVKQLENAYQAFHALSLDVDAAQTYVAKLLALAMLGRYDEALRTGEIALPIFVRAGDQLAAGKVEMNLSNIVSRRSQHEEAKKYCSSARKRFIKAKEPSWQAMAENSLANTYAELNDFPRAQEYFHKALATARAAKMFVTEAEIEANLGNLALLRGELASALNYLERSRQKYTQLQMPHQSAIAELEIADIYSELNLVRAAIEIYERISPIFRSLDLRAEEARSRLNHGKTLLRLGEHKAAKVEFGKAVKLFERERNHSGVVIGLLSISDAELSAGRPTNAATTLKRASAAISLDQNPRHVIALKRLEGMTLKGLGDLKLAETKLFESYQTAKKQRQTDAAQTVLTELGQLAIVVGDAVRAKRYFRQAIKLVEAMRSSLTSDEFSMAFLASRLEPFEGMAQVLLAERKFKAALEMIERGRSRSLLDALGRTSSSAKIPRRLRTQLSENRAELNTYYNRLDLAADSERERLTVDINRAEAKLADVSRQINSLTQITSNVRTEVDLRSIQHDLGRSHTLIEFVEVKGEIGAFVVTGTTIKYIEGLGTVAQINALLERLHFHFRTVRYGTEHLTRFVEQMKQRTDRVLASIFDILLRPLGNSLLSKRLVFVPVGPLYYVPFQSLTDGSKYLIEDHEVVTAPSSAVWQKLKRRKVNPIRKPLLMGYSDARIPLVESEIRALKKIMPTSMTLTGSAATFSAFTATVSKHDLIHLACHGQFRPDNPMFSSLHLSDGWVTVQDICSQRITAELVTLSACETGISEIFGGDEVLGLVRGFLTAGASSLVVSLWAVNDKAGQVLMSELYTHLQRGDTPSASLRRAQLSFVSRGEHPYLWSPFMYIGR